MDNKLIAGIIGITVCIIMFGAIVVPVVQDSQVVLGDPIEYKNTEATTYLLEEYKENVIMDIAVSGGVVVITINGVDNPLGSVANTNVIISDAVTANPNSSGTLLAMDYANGASNNVSGANIAHLEFIDGILTATYNGTQVFSGEYHKLYSLKQDGSIRYKSMSASSPLLIKSINDVCVSAKTTLNGSTTVICVSDGKVYGPSGYTYTINDSLTLKNGTTDVYELSALSVTASSDGGDQTVTFSRVSAPVEVRGHESSGGAYSIVGAIPIVLILSVLVSGVALVGIRRIE